MDEITANEHRKLQAKIDRLESSLETADASERSRIAKLLREARSWQSQLAEMDAEENRRFEISW